MGGVEVSGPGSDFLVHVVCHVEVASHHLVGGDEVVCVKGFDDALLDLTERAVVGYATQHEHA
jgi:hypothetical protein